MLPAQITSEEEKAAVLKALVAAKREAHYWRKQAGVGEDAPIPAEVRSRKRGAVMQDVTPQYSRWRANRAKQAVVQDVDRLPVREQALALDKAIREGGAELQRALSKLPFARQEQFLGAAKVLQTQHEKAHTVDASVDCRLEVPLSFQNLQDCNTFLSRRRRPDGSLDRIVVMPYPIPSACGT